MLLNSILPTGEMWDNNGEVFNALKIAINNQLEEVSKELGDLSLQDNIDMFYKTANLPNNLFAEEALTGEQKLNDFLAKLFFIRDNSEQGIKNIVALYGVDIELIYSNAVFLLTIKIKESDLLLKYPYPYPYKYGNLPQEYFYKSKLERILRYMVDARIKIEIQVI